MSVVKGVAGSGVPTGQTNTIATAATAYGIPHKPQIISTRCAFAEGAINGTIYNSIGLSGTRIEDRSFVQIGPQAASQIQLIVPGFFLSQGGVYEVPLSDFNFEAGIEKVSPSATEQFYFNGLKVGPIAGGHPGVKSDIVQGIDFAAGEQLWIRSSLSAPYQGFLFPVNYNYFTSTDVGYLTSLTTSFVSNTGTLTVPSGNTIAYGVTGVGVQCLIGVPVAPHPSVIIWGDSVGDGNGDTLNNTTGTIGYPARGLLGAGAGGLQLPYQKQTCPGWNFQNSTLTSPFRYRSYWQYATHFYCQMGINDLKGNPSLATMQAYVNNLAAAVKRVIGPYGKPLQFVINTISPCTSSTDNWTTAANQTPVSGFTNGGARDLYNAWLLTQAGNGLIDVVVDVATPVQDPNNHTLWLTDGVTANLSTVDGTHPSTYGHTLMAVPVNTWASSATV